jgi:hypothetical protein
MSTNTTNDEDLFNPENLRVRGDQLNGVNVEKLLTTVPVRKPNKRCSSAFTRRGLPARHGVVGVERQGNLLITPQLAAGSPALASSGCTCTLIGTTTLRCGRFRYRRGRSGKRLAPVARAAAEQAMTRWVRSGQQGDQRLRRVRRRR